MSTPAEELHEAVAGTLHVLRDLTRTLGTAASAAPHLRIDGRPLSLIAADTAGVWGELDEAHRRYLEREHGRPLEPLGPACPYCRGGKRLENVAEGRTVACRVCGGTGVAP